MVKLSKVFVNKLLESRVTWKSFELVLFHFPIGAVSSPAIVSDAVNGRHYAGSMTTSLTVRERSSRWQQGPSSAA